MEETFFWKRLTKKKAIIKGSIILILNLILFFEIGSLPIFQTVPLFLVLATIGFIVFMYGIYTISAPFNYESCKKYLEKQNFKIDTPNMFLYKRFLIKWGKKGAYVYQKNGIVLWVFHDVTFNNEDEVKDFLDRKPDRDKIFNAIPD